MAEIRILHMIGGLDTGGSQSLVINLYKAIDKNKIQFDFIIDEPKQLFYKSVIEELGGKIYTIPKFNGKNFFKVKNAWKKFFIEHPEYKILHSHVRSYASLYIPIAKKFGLKTIIHSHSTSNGKGLIALFKYFLQLPLRYQADYLMSCSSIAGEWLFGKKACKKENYIFVPNALNLADFRFNEQARNDIKAEFNIEGKFVIGHVGCFKKEKNHTFIIDVFNEVVKTRKDAVLFLVGDGNMRADIEQKVKELALENEVIFTGVRGDVNKLIQAMDVFIFPSLWEGLPVTVVEAQTAGLECFISDVITKDVCVTQLVKPISLNCFDSWVNSLLNATGDRVNVLEALSKSGFDMKDTAKKMADFYLSLDK